MPLFTFYDDAHAIAALTSRLPILEHLVCDIVGKGADVSMHVVDVGLLLLKWRALTAASIRMLQLRLFRISQYSYIYNL